MKPANDYTITFPYGATSPPYSSTSPHKGDDRACPTGSPIIVGSRTIGLTGNTGMSTGAHLHIQEWQGSYANTRKPQNAFKGGVVTDVGTSPQFGNRITIRTSDGWNNTYAHLSRMDVAKGDIIKEGDDNMKPYREGIIVAYQNFLDKNPTEQQIKDQLGQEDMRNVYQSLMGETNALIKQLKSEASADYIPVGQLYEKKG